MFASRPRSADSIHEKLVKQTSMETRKLRCNRRKVFLPKSEAEPLMQRDKTFHQIITAIPAVPSNLQLILQGYLNYGVPQTVPKPKNSSSPSTPVKAYSKIARAL